MFDYRRLEIWKLSYNVCLSLYKIVEKFPDCEDKNMKSQLRRCSLSLPLNIAEGSAFTSKKYFLTHLNYSLASSRETEAILYIAKGLGYIIEEEFQKIKEELDLFTSKLVLFMRAIEDECNKASGGTRWKVWHQIKKEIKPSPKTPS
jgi:four helix bundle protein